MKIFLWILCVVFAVLPALGMAAVLQNCVLVMHAPVVYGGVLCALAVIAAAVVYRGKNDAGVPGILFLFFGMASAFCLALEGGAVFYVYALVLCVCSWMVFARTDEPRLLRVCVCVPAGLMIPLILLYMYLGGQMLDRGEMAFSLDSPDGAYSAQVYQRQIDFIDSQTQVIVQDTRVTDCVIGHFQPKPVYLWNERGMLAETLDVQWTDDGTLLINGEAYVIE